jgi:GNAT superfamily N-acetyltransferase
MNDGVRVRPTGPDDVPAVAVLNRGIQALHAAGEPAVFRAPDAAAAAEFFRRQRERDEIVLLLAEVDGEPVGYLMAEELRRGGGPFTLPADVLYIHHIFVADAVRRCGMGRALIDAADAAARERGLSMLQLDHWAFNEAAGRFFAAQGFRAHNIRMRRPTS